MWYALLLAVTVRGFAQQGEQLQRIASVPPSPNVYRVTDFGADPIGVRDSAPAFRSLIARAGDSRHIHVVIPPGRFRLAERVMFTARGNANYYGLHVQGAGPNVTELFVDNDAGGIGFTGTHISRLSVTVSDLTLATARDGAGTALFFDTANPGVTNDRQFTARDIMIRGERFDRGYFEIGVHVRNAWYALLRNVDITQQYQPAIGEKRYSTEHNFLLEDCYSPTIVDCRALNGRYGLVHRAVKTKPEDGIIRGSYFVGHVEGIVLDLKRGTKEWPEPGFHIDNCHVNYRDRGIVLKGVQQANISHCLFYCHDRTGTRWYMPDRMPVPGGSRDKRRDYRPRDIDIEYGSNIIIAGNIFTEPANYGRVAIRIAPPSGHISISGNQFNLAGTAVLNESTRPSTVCGNMFGGWPSWSVDKGKWSGPLTRYDDRTGSLRIGRQSGSERDTRPGFPGRGLEN